MKKLWTLSSVRPFQLNNLNHYSMKQIFTLLMLSAAFVGTSQTTFNVDMTCAPEFTDVFVTGPWCGWCGNEGYNQASDDDGDGIYTVTLADLTGNDVAIEYKYAINGFASQENLVNDMAELGGTCAPITDYANYANRTTFGDTVNDDTYGTCDGTCNDSTVIAETVAVTFNVDMSEYTGAYGTVNLNGSFNGWCGACATMTDADGDGIYTISVDLNTEATVEYKFTLDGWTAQEMFTPGESCTSTIDGYTNRTLTVGTEATELAAVCYNSCEACSGGGGGDDTYTVTFNLNMALEEVSPTGVYLAGGMNFGVPGDNPMTDDDGDGIYSITVTVDAGFSGHYTFTNGACGDWSCKENLAGLPCGDPSNYNDRFLPAVNQNTVISTCFGQCSTDGSCVEINPVPVTFRVDMSEQLVVSGVTIFGGSINGWNNTATPMSDDNGDGIYEVTLDLLPGGHEYKFVNSGVEESFDPIVHGECTVTTPDSVYTNRYLLIETDEAFETIAYCYNACDACTPDNINELVGFDFQIVPSVTADVVELRFNGGNTAIANVSVVSFTGALVDQFQVPANAASWTLDMGAESTGVYFVQMELNGFVATHKLVKVQ